MQLIHSRQPASHNCLEHSCLFLYLKLLQVSENTSYLQDLSENIKRYKGKLEKTERRFACRVRVIQIQTWDWSSGNHFGVAQVKLGSTRENAEWFPMRYE